MLLFRSSGHQLYDLSQSLRKRHPWEVSVAAAQTAYHFSVERGAIVGPQQVGPFEIDKASTEPTETRVREAKAMSSRISQGD